MDQPTNAFPLSRGNMCFPRSFQGDKIAVGQSILERKDDLHLLMELVAGERGPDDRESVLF